MALLSSSSRVSNSYEVEGILKSGSEERVASNVVELVGGGGGGVKDMLGTLLEEED